MGREGAMTSFVESSSNLQRYASGSSSIDCSMRARPP